jgi:DNA polymerase-1
MAQASSPSYKENRAHITPPILRPILKQYVLDNFKSYAKDTLEGDDIGIPMTHPSIIPGQKIGVSMDKDMKTIPGLHYNTKRDEFFEITPKEADFWHMMQTLTGDITDGYKGCPGIGQVFAQEYLTKLLKPVPYQHEFKRGPRKGLFETRYRIERAEHVGCRPLPVRESRTDRRGCAHPARVARICRHTDYDFKRKEVILWTP